MRAKKGASLLRGAVALGLVLGLGLTVWDLFNITHHSQAIHGFSSLQRRGPLRQGDLDCSAVGFPGESISAANLYHTVNISNSRHSSCKSKYLQHCFWRALKRPPSVRFLSALREYEALHQRCVEGHNLTEHVLQGTSPPGCQYLVWKELDGKGNQLISLVSAFVYSLLTRRTLLITPEAALDQLLCEPFPRSSWTVPDGFPEDWVRQQSGNQGDLYARAENRTQEMQKHGVNVIGLPKHLSVGLDNFSPLRDQRFFCQAEQKLIEHIPWLYFRSNQFSAPGLYFLPNFRKSLNELFPDQGLFLHAGRYLLSPTNDVWRRIMRFYDAYLASADIKLGIQVRTWTTNYKPLVSKHILKCAVGTGLLPDLNNETDHRTQTHRSSETLNPPPPPKRIAVLMTSLDSAYPQELKESFVRPDDVENNYVTVITPSSEVKQRIGHLEHDKKAITDMWLLSFMDDMISTPRSTFGQLAYGLAGITPVVFRTWGIDDQQVPEDPCGRTNLAGPCFIDHPEHMACPMDPPGSLGVGDVDHSVPEVSHCLHQWGIGVRETSSLQVS